MEKEKIKLVLENLIRWVMIVETMSFEEIIRVYGMIESILLWRNV